MKYELKLLSFVWHIQLYTRLLSLVL